jgi:hypothetical protein
MRLEIKLWFLLSWKPEANVIKLFTDVIYEFW